MNFKTLVLGLFLLCLVSAFASAATQVYAPAVDSNGEGILTPITVTATQGSGRIRTDIQGSLIATETEDSIRTAAQAAAKEANVNLQTVDINVDIDSDAQVIDGPSGGMAFGVAIYNELIRLSNQNADNIRNDLVVTGAITSDGTAVKVGGVEEKVIAANKSGITLMLIAAGQSANDAFDYVVFAAEISSGKLQVVEVSTLNNALQYAYTASNSRVDAPERAIRPLVLNEFQASEKTLHMRQVAVEEIEAARRELAAANEALQRNGARDAQTTAVLRSVNETLKNAQEAVNKGYYYTGANAAFLAHINLQTVNAEGKTTADLQQLVTQLELELQSFNAQRNVTDKNYEQIAAAQLRYWWASTRLQEVKEELQSTNAISIGVTRDYYNAKAWFEASKELMQHAESIQNGNTVNTLNIREYSFDLLEQSEEIANGSTDSEVQWHLKTAKNAIAGGDYIAAAFDLQFVVSAERTNDAVLGKNPDQLLNEYGQTENAYADGAVWAELYFANAVYSLQEANNTNEVSSIVTAVRLKQLAAAFQEAKEAIANEFVNPRPTKNRTIEPLNTLPQVPNVTATITPSEDVGTLQIIALLVIAAGVAILASVFLSKMKPTHRELTASEMLEKLDQALVSGRISEETYKRLRQKYTAKVKSTKTSSQRLKTRRSR